MKQYPFAPTRLNKILFGIFLTVMLLLCRDTLLTSSIIGFQKSQLLMLGCIVVAAVIFLINRRHEFKTVVHDDRVGLLMLATAVLQLPMVGKQDWQLMYFSVLLCLYFAVFLTYFVSTQAVAKYYVVILAVLGIYSMAAAYVLRLLPDNGLLPVPVFYNSLDVAFYNFGLSNVPLEYSATRNFGIFREPGVYQYFIMLALFLNSYVVSWDKERTMWLLNGLFAVLMLTTFATGGYVELFLFALVLFIDKKLYRSKIAWIVVAAAVACVAAVLAYAYLTKSENLLYWELYGMVVSKIFGGEESSTDRIGSLIANMSFFLKNPLFGGKLAEVLNSMENNTSSTTLMFAIFGLLGGALHVAGWIVLVWEKNRKTWVNLALLLVLFMSFNTQNLIADVFLWLLPTMALTERVLRWKTTETEEENGTGNA